MKWYTVNDIMAGYSLSKWKLTSMCRTNEIGAMRIRDERYKNSPGRWLIPDCALWKLEAYKTGEPTYKEEHQPSEYLTWKNRADEEKRMGELVGDYKAYLRSPEWQEVRRRALLRDGEVCQMCGTGINLRVHHVNYEHVGTEQELDDVVTLCEECHSKVHVKDYVRRGTHEHNQDD